MSLDIDLSAELCASLGKATESMDRLRRLQRAAWRATTPVFYRIAQNGVFPASGSLILKLGGPDQGHFWYVRSIQVGGLTPTTGAAGRADIFVSAGDLRIYSTLAAPLGQIGLADWRDQTNALPNIAPYNAGALPLRLSEDLYVIFSNGTPGQTYVAAAQVIDYEEAATHQDWAI